MSDKDIRAGGANQPVPEFDNPAFNPLRQPLSESRVAIVTTAALRTVDQPKWTGGDQSFRVLGPGTEGLVLVRSPLATWLSCRSHRANHFDKGRGQRIRRKRIPGGTGRTVLL